MSAFFARKSPEFFPHLDYVIVVMRLVCCVHLTYLARLR